MLEVFLEALAKWVRDLVETDELLDLLHLRMISGCTRVEALDDGTHVAEDARVHQRWQYTNDIAVLRSDNIFYLIILLS